jgi:hypothetical protein
MIEIIISDDNTVAQDKNIPSTVSTVSMSTVSSDGWGDFLAPGVDLGWAETRAVVMELRKGLGFMVEVLLSPSPDPVLIFFWGGSISSDPRPIVVVVTDEASVAEEEFVVAPTGEGVFDSAVAAFLLLSLLRVL